MTGTDLPPDRGEPDPALAAALAAGDVAAIRVAMVVARLLVPVLATGDDTGVAEMAAPRLVGADGRHALPVFTSYDALRAWRADARPVPMLGEQALIAAVDEGYDAVVLDVAGPVTHVLEIERPTA